MARIRMMPGGSPVAVEENFQRIENATEALYDIDRGVVNVVGSLVVTTRLSRVDSVVACLANTPPVAGACFIIAYPYSLGAGPVNQIILGVYTNGFAASGLSVPISWIAAGEMMLG